MFHGKQIMFHIQKKGTIALINMIDIFLFVFLFYYMSVVQENQNYWILFWFLAESF